jgi:uncharacterized protein (TIGR03435 family)
MFAEVHIMKKIFLSLLCIFALTTVSASSLHAQNASPAPDISGTWQGTLPVGKGLRIVLKISKADSGGWKAAFYSIDQTPQPIPVSSITLQGTTLKFAITLASLTYEGTLSADGKTITGNSTQAGQSYALVLSFTTPDNAWAIPEPTKPMAADADPTFDVATIKPNLSGKPSLQGLTLQGRKMIVRNGSLDDLITFAYSLQVKQVVNATGWMDSDRYDIDAIPDQPGTPNVDQMRIMVRKMLADRFKLTFHHEKRDLSAYVLTAGKTGQKLTPTQLKMNLPGFYASPGTGGLTLHLINGTMNDFTSFLQMLVLDKPVVDQTGITGRFDCNVTFTPDQTQFNGNSPKLPASDVPDAPDLFTAIQQQLGLKLSAEKTAVDVIVIDHVEKPSPN